MATMIIDNNVDDNNGKDAKLALRDALRAKLKTSSFDESIIMTTTTSNNNIIEESSTKLIDVETIGNDSDDSGGDSDDKMDDKDTTLTSAIPIEERRLRNRLAARKCREKRKNRINNLEKICNNLESRISMLKNEIDGLNGQKESLTRLLQNHDCVRLVPKPTAVITNAVLSSK